MLTILVFSTFCAFNGTNPRFYCMTLLIRSVRVFWTSFITLGCLCEAGEALYGQRLSYRVTNVPRPTRKFPFWLSHSIHVFDNPVIPAVSESPLWLYFHTRPIFQTNDKGIVISVPSARHRLDQIASSRTQDGTRNGLITTNVAMFIVDQLLM